MNLATSNQITLTKQAELRCEPETDGREAQTLRLCCTVPPHGHGPLNKIQSKIALNDRI